MKFYKQIICLCAAMAITAGLCGASKPPFKVLHSNDTTNITSCPAPWKDTRTGISDKFIRSSVDEVEGSGIDVHMLQPGMGWVPWWPSKVLPMEEHVAWKKSQGLRIDGWYEQFVLDGGDYLKSFVEECRLKGQHPFFSFRMNDQHHIYGANSGKLPPEEFEQKAGIYQFYKEHPDWRIGNDGFWGRADSLSMDFAVPEVRNYRLMQIKELIENYDIDGFELDFMRHWAMFNQKKTTSEQRAQILTDMVKEVRGYLDAARQRDGRYRYLSIRIPGYVAAHDSMGIDLKKLATEAGVDIVNASGHYFTDNQLNIAEIRKQLPDNVALYAELQYTNAIGPMQDVGNGKQHWPARRCTKTQLNTAAYLARKRGADGVSTFNFQYYRGTYSPLDVLGTPQEPPYEVFQKISDVDWLSKQPQQYVVAFIWNSPNIPNRPFQKPMVKGKPVTIKLDMAPPAGGWVKDGKLRIQGRQSLKGMKWRARLNKTELKPIEDVSDPFGTPYDVAIGQPEDYFAWKVPAKLLKDGINEFDLLLERGADESYIFLMDVSMPGPEQETPQEEAK